LCHHHVARTQSRCPPGPTNRAYLSLHLPEAPQGWRPFAPVLHLQQHELGPSLHLRTKPRVSPTPVVNHSSLRSGHPSTTGTLLFLSFEPECTISRYQTCEGSILLHWNQNEVWERFRAFRLPSACKKMKNLCFGAECTISGTKLPKHPFYSNGTKMMFGSV
jgi:hypothetical protein